MLNQLQMLVLSDHEMPFLKHSEFDIQQEFREYMVNNGYRVVAENVVDWEEKDYAKIRHLAFGASDASVLLRVSYESSSVSQKTIEELLREKIEEISDPSIGEKASVRKGKELEDLLIHKFEKRMNAIIIKPRDMYGTKRGTHTNFDGVIFEAIVDGDVMLHRPIPFEIKLCTLYGRKNYNWKLGISEFSTNPTMIPDAVLPVTVDLSATIQDHINSHAAKYGIPAYYYTQLQQQIMYTNAPHGYLGVMDDNEWTLYTFKIPRDQHVIDELQRVSFHAFLRLAKAKNIKLDLPTPKEGDF